MQKRPQAHRPRLYRSRAVKNQKDSWKDGKRRGIFLCISISYNARYTKYRGVKKPSFRVSASIRTAVAVFGPARAFCVVFAMCAVLFLFARNGLLFFCTFILCGAFLPASLHGSCFYSLWLGLLCRSVFFFLPIASVRICQIFMPCSLHNKKRTGFVRCGLFPGLWLFWLIFSLWMPCGHFSAAHCACGGWPAFITSSATIPVDYSDCSSRPSRSTCSPSLAWPEKASMGPEVSSCASSSFL